jgi:hypothetical protein
MRGPKTHNPKTQAKEIEMSSKNDTIWYVSNRYNAEPACQHCGGTVRHESWCITRDPVVYYAYQIVADPSQLTLQDSLILHSLGVIWDRNSCRAASVTVPKKSAPSTEPSRR